ncbi:MAG: hypothetical protein RLY86_4034 [Pseudomonadota bacterium]|jgi:molybdopterin synthase catalytic subunit
MTVRVQAEDFDPGVELSRLTAGNTAIGGVTSFIGMVRDMHARDMHDKGPGGRSEAGTPVRSMTLEHYPGMTERQLAAIEAEANARWPLDATLIIHRFGRLEPGDRIVMVAVASAHRAAAFEACWFLIDWLKTKAPFWKQEETPEGERWVEARETDQAAADRWNP